MMKYEYISREWIVSVTARRVYRLAAVLSVGLLPVLSVLLSQPGLADLSRAIARPLLFTAVLAMALTLIGMEYFLFRFDDSHPLKQIFWFCVMLFLPIGPAVYCFVVYSNSPVVRATCADGAQTV